MRRDGELPEFDQASLGGYEYRYAHLIAPASGPDADLTAMAAMLKDPNRFFPFNVLGVRPEGMQEGDGLLLANRRELNLPPGQFPVRVKGITPTSFTFTTEPGHFDPPGSTITFTTWTDGAGNLHSSNTA